MKTKYRKFTIGKGKYSFWLRLNQTLTPSVKAYSKAITVGQRRKHAEADYYHNCRRKSKRLKEVLLGLSRAKNMIGDINAYQFRKQDYRFY